MLHKLRIQNFKGWKDTGEIKMAPLTLFFGGNSSGKSSIGQFLMLLKQTVDSSDQKIVLYPGGKNTPVNVGSFQEFIYNRDSANKLNFSYRWKLEQETDIPRDNRQDFAGKTLTFEASIGQSNSTLKVPVVEKFVYTLSPDKKKQEQHNFILGMERINESTGYKLLTEGIDLKRKKGRAWQFKAPIRFYGFPNEVINYHHAADCVSDLNLAHENLFKKIFYLGPMRENTERVYSWAGIEPESVGYSGANTIAAILSAKDRKINFKKRGSLHNFEKIIALKLKDMGLIEEFMIKQLSEIRQDFEVLVKTKGAERFVNLPDVGFGISQLLPVLVQLFYAPPNSIIIIEQPEIHLHPAAQSALADVMIDAINSHENGKKRNIQLIIETHSEHFLRRLQRRIAESKDVKEKDVSLYFANTANKPTTLDTINIDTYGNILNWPKDFFGNEMEDIANQTEAALTRKLEQKR